MRKVNTITRSSLPTGASSLRIAAPSSTAPCTFRPHASSRRPMCWSSIKVMPAIRASKIRKTLDNFLRRGGGIVSLHDALCGPNPEQFAGFVGGAKKHGEVNYTLEADVPYTVAYTAHPIRQGFSNMTIKDEAFFNMTWSKTPEIHVLATAVMAKTPSAGTHAGEVVPQIWTYEKGLLPGAPAFRAFVWMQGHNYSNFADPQIQAMLLRGISWVGKRPADALATERPAGRGARWPGERTVTMLNFEC